MGTGAPANHARRRRRVIQVLLSLLLGFLGASDGAFAEALPGAAVPQTVAGGQGNSWSATTSNGRTYMGTWTAVADPASGTVSGTWTLIAQGRVMTSGVWSAAKAPAGWTGSWRARVASSKAEYSGTWSTAIQLKADARFADLFEQALKAAVSGNWRAGAQSGAWSIRAYK
jgi:hypothetical protein